VPLVNPRIPHGDQNPVSNLIDRKKEVYQVFEQSHVCTTPIISKPTVESPVSTHRQQQIQYQSNFGGLETKDAKVLTANLTAIHHNNVVDIEPPACLGKSG
jgi:hypothetical protein